MMIMSLKKEPFIISIQMEIVVVVLKSWICSKSAVRPQISCHIFFIHYWVFSASSEGPWRDLKDKNVQNYMQTKTNLQSFKKLFTFPFCSPFELSSRSPPAAPFFLSPPALCSLSVSRSHAETWLRCWLLCFRCWCGCLAIVDYDVILF